MDDEKTKYKLKNLRIALIGVFILMMTMIIGYIILYPRIIDDQEIKYAIIVTSSIVICVISFAIASVILKSVGISNKTEALGLPEGSIRSFIALILICVFFIITIIMYEEVASSKTKTMQSISEDFYKTIPEKNIVSQHIDSLSNESYIKLSTPFLQKAKVDKVKDLPDTLKHKLSALAQKAQIKESDKIPQYTLEVLAPSNPEATDFAKNFQTAFITLISAICAFYFGAKTVQSATSAALNSQNTTAQNSIKLVSKVDPTWKRTTPPMPVVLVFETTPQNKQIKVGVQGDNENVAVKHDPNNALRFEYTPTTAASAQVTITASLIDDPSANTKITINIDQTV